MDEQVKRYQIHASLGILALVLWREARSESDECLAAIACVFLTRAANPRWWGGNLMDVLTKRYQVSSLTDPKDKQLTTWPQYGDKHWNRCMRMAGNAIYGLIQNPFPGADHYHDISIPPPKWATADRFVGQIDRVKFYNIEEKAV